jgi:arylsulfatase A-like enzyme
MFDISWNDDDVISTQPNLVVIMTDEHNLRTIGAYRNFFREKNQPEQADVWGAGNQVDTPNIDRLASEGALFTNFYTNKPNCTPSRASFMSGLYPRKTGAYKNRKKMSSDIKTWAHYLQLNKYKTRYNGKWHLDGPSFPGVFLNLYESNVEQLERSFGFNDNFFRFNDGHFKFLDIENKTLQLYEFDEHFETPSKHFTTDFLFNKGIQQIKRSVKKKEPFAIMLSIPDPHGPNLVRKPFQNMYDTMNFEVPATMEARYRGHQTFPNFANTSWKNAMGMSIDKTEKEISQFKRSVIFQREMRQYFGMVKCIDHNVGKLMNLLAKIGIEEDTIIVFTSDHGDMLYEHGKRDKGLPYKTSAGVPFIVKYPKKIKQGKVVETARSHIDFMPTILNLMGINHEDSSFDGKDFSSDLLSSEQIVNDIQNIIHMSGNRWVAAVSSQFKLVQPHSLESGDSWLFDLENEPDELINYYNDETYFDAKQILTESLNDRKKK